MLVRMSGGVCRAPAGFRQIRQTGKRQGPQLVVPRAPGVRAWASCPRAGVPSTTLQSLEIGDNNGHHGPSGWESGAQELCRNTRSLVTCPLSWQSSAPGCRRD